METVQLKLKLVENEKAYRDRFFSFVQVLVTAADDLELFKQTKTKTILKICQEVLNCSDDLLVALDNQKRISQQSEAIYKVFEEHHVQAVGILSTYCTNLLDIRSLLLSSLITDSNGLKLSRFLNEALQPVHHVGEVLKLLKEIKGHLDAKRRLVEIFSCNSLTDQLTKGVERMHRVIAGLHLEELSLALQEMSMNDDSCPAPLAAASLAEDSDTSNAEKNPETLTSYAELSWPTTSNGNQRNLEGQIGAVIQMEGGSPVYDDEIPHRPVQSQDTGFVAEERRFEIPDKWASLTEELDERTKEKLSETSTTTETKLSETSTKTETKLSETSATTETKLSETFGTTETKLSETSATTETKLSETSTTTETKLSETSATTETKLSETSATTETKLSETSATTETTERQRATATEATVRQRATAIEATVRQRATAIEATVRQKPTATEVTVRQRTTETESNEHKSELESQEDAVKKKIENDCLRNADNGSQSSSQPQSTAISVEAVRQFNFPNLEMQVRKKPPVPSPRTKGTVNSVLSDGTSSEGDHTKNKQIETALMRRESKKLIRVEVQTMSMQISQMKNDILSLEKKIVSLESSEGSESDDQDIDREYPEVFEVSENASSCSQNVDAECLGVNLRSASIHYDAGLRDRRTKHLLHSTIWQVPLYQEYHVDMTAETTASVSAPGEHVDEPEGVEATKIANRADSNSRPESGIGLEGGDADEPVGSYYTPMWNNGSRLVESVSKSLEYVSMHGIRHSDRCSYGQLIPNHKNNAWKWEETEYSSTSRDSSSCQYMSMNRTYANTGFGNASEIQDESVYNSVHDIFGAVQVEKEAAAQETFCKEEVAFIVPPSRAKQMPGWCNIPAVKESGILEKMCKREKHLQEAKYELISSKVSYLKSLSVLQAIFIENVHLKRLMSTTEWDNLFKYIGPIKQCSEHFLADLLSGWPQDMFMSNQLLVVRQYALTGLQTYVNYCSNKVTMDKTLAEIRSNNLKVNSMLKKLEGDEICDNNTLESFLVLPIQRITRFPLLVEGILCRMDSNTDKDFCAWAKTYRELAQMAKRCNDAVRKSEETVEIRRAEKTIPGRNRISSPFRRSSKSTTLPKRKR